MTGREIERRLSMTTCCKAYDFVDVAGRMPVARGHVAQMVASTRVAIDCARAQGAIVVKIANEFPSSHIVGNLFRHRAALAGSPGAAWDPRLSTPGAVYIPKSKPSAFSNPTLGMVLEAAGARELVVTGLYARACVTATVNEALDRGLDVTVLADALACRSDSSRAAAVERLSKRGAHITTANQFAAAFHRGLQ